MSSNGNRRIWVVDDSALEAKEASRAFGAGFDVELFSDGGAMLEALARGAAPDAVVLDWHMPGMSGIEITEFLRGRPATAALPVVLLTGFRETADVVRGLTAGANDYVIKPYAPEELTARVKSLLRTRELRERAERAEAVIVELLQQLPEAMLAIDDAGVIRFVNAPAGELLGGGAALVGRRIHEVLPALPLQALADGADSGADLQLGDELFAPAVRRLHLADFGGGFTVTLRNVTATRRVEHRRLDFYSMIAHDLRSPLSAIAMRVELLRRGARGPLSAEAVADLDKMLKRVHGLVALINDFLDLARIEGTGLEIERATFDLNALVAEVVDEFRPMVEAAHVALRFAPAAALPVVGDRHRLAQVLTNLVSNAVKFTPVDGRVDITTAAPANCVEVRISDTGCGIATDVLPSLFQRYSRVRHTEAVSGTGLGLLIVREIVEAHGGAVGVTSDLGRGSTFWFRLPGVGKGQARA